MIKSGTIIKCANDTCSRILFRTLKDIEKEEQINLINLQDCNLLGENLPLLGGAMVCPFCTALFLIPKSCRNPMTRIHTDQGWVAL